MIKHILQRIGSFFLVAVLVISMLPPMEVFAADLDTTKLPSGLSASYEGDTSNSQQITWTPSVSDNAGEISGTAIAGKVCSGISYSYYACNTSLTITNTSGEDKILEFNYNITVSSSSCSVTVAGTTYKENKTNLKYSGTLKANNSITIVLTTESKEDATASISITNLKLVSGSQNITVGFAAPSGGSYTANGTAVTAATSKTAPATTVYNLVATPASGYSFVGWINTVDNSLLGSTATMSITPKDGVTIKPVFAASSEAWFLAGGTVLYNSLNDAATYASTAAIKTVILMSNGTLGAGDYTIPAGVTLVIPFDDANTLVTTAPPVVLSYDPYSRPTAYRMLTMANGAKLILNGSLSVGGSLAASQTMGYNGLPVNKLGYIKMESGSSIVANSGSSMYVIGYIYGSGSVTVNSGATVYECFQIRDFRGGNATGTMRSAKKAFPLSQYYVQNIEVPMTVNAGAIVNAISAFNISGGVQTPVIPFIGNSDSYMFKIGSDSIEKDYVESTDRLHVKINGNLTVSPFTFEIPGFLEMASIDTNNFNLPINHNITIEVASGKNLTISQSLEFLPGAELLINEGATCTISTGKKVVLFDSAEWGNYCGEQHYKKADDVPLKPLIWVAGGAPLTDRFTTDAAALADAALRINGTLNATAGKLYATASGANIYSTANGVLNQGDSPGEVNIYVAQQDGSSISQSGASDALPDLYAYAVKLRQEDSSYLDTAGKTATNYYHAHYTCEHETGGSSVAHGVWYTVAHDNASSVVTQPTCTTGGYTTYTCTCGHSYTGDAVAALGHNMQQTSAAVAPTCTSAGKTAVLTCANGCGTTEGGAEVAATGHQNKVAIGAAKAPTCTETGITAGEKCSDCGTVITAQATIPATGHTEVIDAAVVPTCTATGLTEGKHCSVCNAVIVAQQVVAATGHTAGEAVKENVTASSYDSVIYCTICGAEISRETIQTVIYSVTISWEQISTATYIPAQTTYTWLPTQLKYTSSTTEAKWTGTSVVTITVDNSGSTGAVKASFGYNESVAGNTAWTGLSDNTLAVAADGEGVATLTVTPTGTPEKPTTGTEVTLGTITITLEKGGT